MFKKRYRTVKCPSTKQVYNWINQRKININKNDMCYKRRKNKKKGRMMKHTKWNLENKTVLPISLRPVSYTHLDVYKRQILGNATDSIDNLEKGKSWKFKVVYENVDAKEVKNFKINNVSTY